MIDAKGLQPLVASMYTTMKVYHIIWVTHNSRVSERMIEYGVERGEPVVLKEKEEIEITEYILEIVWEEKIRVISYNICRDHVHMLIVCEEDKRDEIVRRLKGKSAQLYKQNHDPKGRFHLWAQKYGWTEIKNDRQLEKTGQYIEHNRQKHNLPNTKGLQPLVTRMCMSFDKAISADKMGNKGL